MPVSVRFRQVVVATAVLGAAWSGPGLAADDIDGRDVYNFRCYFCHGYSGDGKTLAAEMLDPEPRDFTSVTADALSREAMLDAVRHGRPGTAMKPFANVLSDAEIVAVVDFVRDEFMTRGAPNTRYHTVANGWPDHERFAAAFPFVRGEIPLDADEERLTAAERAGRQLYMRSCVS
ncbi:MAG: cytochrome c, partial [Gammaproteobacteria bacterium]|nr:cytochrome c [Gammaproteobacteria bacterium]